MQEVKQGRRFFLFYFPSWKNLFDLIWTSVILNLLVLFASMLTVPRIIICVHLSCGLLLTCREKYIFYKSTCTRRKACGFYCLTWKCTYLGESPRSHGHEYPSALVPRCSKTAACKGNDGSRYHTVCGKALPGTNPARTWQRWCKVRQKRL
jgi:hypothetical protein